MRFQYDISARNANKFFTVLILIELCLAVIYIIGVSTGHPTIFFDLDGEENLPTWFSTIQLFLISLVFFLCSLETRAKYLPSALFLKVVGAGFIFLSVDETAQIHEKLTSILKHLEWMPRFKGDNGIWIFLYAFIGIVAYAITFREVVKSWKYYRRATLFIIIGFAISIFGGALLEAVSYEFLRNGSTPILYTLEVATEETFEMFGITLMLYGALLLLTDESYKKSKLPNNKIVPHDI